MISIKNDQWQDEIEKLTNASHYIDLLNEIMKNTTLSDEQLCKIKQHLTAAKERLVDKQLYTAVIGEFSSGKSTVINALLRHNLLKSAPMATTASVTTVTHANNFTIKAKFTNGKSIIAFEDDYRDLLNHVVRLSGALNKLTSMNDVLDALTSDKIVANYVISIDIGIPSDNLKNGLSIIDTPGINAGVYYAENHTAITDVIVEEKADVAIVLIPSYQPLSKTLISYLDTQVRPFIHRCIFVITAMDNCPENERNDVTAYVRDTLKDNLGLENPMIFDTAAITVLPNFRASLGKEKEGLKWQREFEEFEQKLFDQLVKQRATIISERLVRILRDALEELKSMIDVQSMVLIKEGAILKANSIPNIESVLKTLLDQYVTNIGTVKNRQIREVTDAGKYFCSTSISRTRKEIDGAEWHNSETRVNHTIPEFVNDQGSRFLVTINGCQSKINSKARESADELNKQFFKYYRALQVNEVVIKIPSTAMLNIKVSATTFSSAYSAIIDNKEERNELTMKGAFLGGVVGFVFGGPPGAMAGVAIGGKLGRDTSGIEEHREIICNHVLPTVKEHIEMQISTAENHLEMAYTHSVSALKKLADTQLNNYSSIVNNMIDIHNKKVEKTKIQSQQAEINISALENSIKKIISDTSKLKVVSV